MSEHADEQHSYRAQGPATPNHGAAEASLFELSIEQSRLLDRLCVERYGIPSIVFMENAALGLTQHARSMLESCADPSVLIFAGPGNNGGDGFALARHLHNAHIPTRVVIVQSMDAYTGDAGINLNIIRRMEIEIIEARAFLEQRQGNQEPLLVDALFGTGLSRAIEGCAADLIAWINTAHQKRGARVLSVDCPSGLDVQRGEPIGKQIVHADRTITFAGLKPGMSRVEALEYLGDVFVAPIGAPIELLSELGRPLQPRHR